MQSQIDLDRICTYGWDGARNNPIFYMNGQVEFYPNGNFPEPIFSRRVYSERFVSNNENGVKRDAAYMFNSYSSIVSQAWGGLAGKA